MAVTVYVPTAVHPEPGVNEPEKVPLPGKTITSAKTATFDGFVIVISTVPPGEE